MDETTTPVAPTQPETPVNQSTVPGAHTIPSAQPPLPPLPSATQMLSWAFTFYKARLALMLGISAVPFVLGVLVIPDFLGQKYLPPVVFGIFSVLNALATLFVSLVVLAGITQEHSSVGDAYRKGGRMIFSGLWIMALTFTAVMGGMFLLVIPGLIVSLLLGFPLLVLFTENTRGLGALVSSWRYVKGYWWAIFGRGAFFGLIVLLAVSAAFIVESLLGVLASSVQIENHLSQIITTALLSLFVSPLGSIYMYGMYLAVRQAKQGIVMSPEDEKSIRRKITALSILGIVGMLVLLGLAVVLAMTLLGSHGPLPSGGQPQVGVSGASVMAPMLEMVGR